MAGDDGLGALLEESAAIMARLRGPGGCPWDREQTPATLRRYTLEETYEVLDAIEREDWPHLEEELGDLLLQVLFYAQIASEEGHFSLAGVLAGLNRKLVRRHPHVFGAEAAAAAGGLPASELAGSTAEDNGEIETATVLASWAAIKANEKAARTAKAAKLAAAGRPGSGIAAAEQEGYLHGVLRGQAALSEAASLGKAAARAGFDWPTAAGLVEKIREEAEEVEAELAFRDRSVHPAAGQGAVGGGHSADRLREEVGDLLFTAANLARHLKVDPELTLRDANAKFRRRFQAMEQASHQPLETLTADELERAWARVKQMEEHA